MSERANIIKTKGELADGGWKESSLSGGHHLARTVEMYEELGFEVYLEEIDPESCNQCTTCYESGNETMYRVYTRSKTEGEA